MRVLNHTSCNDLYLDLSRCLDQDNCRIVFATCLERITARAPSGARLVSIKQEFDREHISISTTNGGFEVTKKYSVRDGRLHECNYGWTGFVVRIDADVMEFESLDDLMKKMMKRRMDDDGARHCLRWSSTPGLYTYSMPWKLSGARTNVWSYYNISGGFSDWCGPDDKILEIGLDYEDGSAAQPLFCKGERGKLVRQQCGKDQWEIVALGPDEHVADLLNPGDFAELPSKYACKLFCDTDNGICAKSNLSNSSDATLAISEYDSELARIISDANDEMDITSLLDGELGVCKCGSEYYDDGYGRYCDTCGYIDEEDDECSGPEVKVTGDLAAHGLLITNAKNHQSFDAVAADYGDDDLDIANLLDDEDDYDDDYDEDDEYYNPITNVATCVVCKETKLVEYDVDKKDYTCKICSTKKRSDQVKVADATTDQSVGLARKLFRKIMGA